MKMKARPQRRMSGEFGAPGEELRLGFDGGMEVRFCGVLARRNSWIISCCVCRTEVTTAVVCCAVVWGKVDFYFQELDDCVGNCYII